MNELITILGPTATGKTSLAAALAIQLKGEIISADSRQVYRGMDMGTGKDLDDYTVGEKMVPYHLINIADPGEEYNVFAFQQDFLKAYHDINERGRKAIMCGGSGMYLESVLLAYVLEETTVNEKLRRELENLTTEELIKRLNELRDIHNITDTKDRDRLIRAIEIEDGRGPFDKLRTGSRQKAKGPSTSSGQAPGIRQRAEGKRGKEFPPFKHYVFGISLPREEIRNRITRRLKQRLDEGMVEEVRNLLASGVTPDQLDFYGLEYKYLTQYVTGKINFNDLFQRLNSAIHQFAKRQMTWYRRMEKRGVVIVWIDGEKSVEDRVEEVKQYLND